MVLPWPFFHTVLVLRWSSWKRNKKDTPKVELNFPAGPISCFQTQVHMRRRWWQGAQRCQGSHGTSNVQSTDASTIIRKALRVLPEGRPFSTLQQGIGFHSRSVMETMDLCHMLLQNDENVSIEVDILLPAISWANQKNFVDSGYCHGKPFICSQS